MALTCHDVCPSLQVPSLKSLCIHELSQHMEIHINVLNQGHSGLLQDMHDTITHQRMERIHASHVITQRYRGDYTHWTCPRLDVTLKSNILGYDQLGQMVLRNDHEFDGLTWNYQAPLVDDQLVLQPSEQVMGVVSNTLRENLSLGYMVTGHVPDDNAPQDPIIYICQYMGLLVLDLDIGQRYMLLYTIQYGVLICDEHPMATMDCFEHTPFYVIESMTDLILSGSLREHQRIQQLDALILDPILRHWPYEYRMAKTH